MPGVRPWQHHTSCILQSAFSELAAATLINPMTNLALPNMLKAFNLLFYCSIFKTLINTVKKNDCGYCSRPNRFSNLSETHAALLLSLIATHGKQMPTHRPIYTHSLGLLTHTYRDMGEHTCSSTHTCGNRCTETHKRDERCSSIWTTDDSVS